MTDAISGRFDYNSLKSTLRQKGVKATNMYAALKQVAVDNHIDDIKNLDDKKEIKISESIFNKGQTDNSSNINPIEAIGNLFFSNPDNQTSFLVGAKQINFDDTDKLPEVYNDDDYEVVDYDEFYNFGDNNNVQAHTMEARFPAGNGPQKEGDPNPQSPELMQFFTENSPYNQPDNAFAFNLNASNPIDGFNQNFLNQRPDIMANPAFSFIPQPDKNYSTEVNDKDREDLLEGAMEMDMDMSGNTFNA